MKDITKEKLADKLQFLHSKFHLELNNGTKSMVITCCQGAVYYRPTQEMVSIENLIRQADKELYKCEEMGKACFAYEEYPA